MSRILSAFRPLSILLLALLVPGTADRGVTDPSDDRSPSIEDLAVQRADGRYQAAFRLEGAFDPETRTSIASGLETSVEYRVEVLRQRRFWPDERVRQHRIQASVRYHSLSRQYGLTLWMDGEVMGSSTTDQEAEMERWMTEIRQIDLGPTTDLVPPEDFVVRVKSNLKQRFVLFFIPWNRDTGWVRVPLVSARTVADEPRN